MRLAETSGKPIAQIARELGISDSAIHGWKRELSKHGSEAFAFEWASNPTRSEEVRRLKREVERLQQERDILKKVLSISSRDQR